MQSNSFLLSSCRYGTQLGRSDSSHLVWPSTEGRTAAFWCSMLLRPTLSKPWTAGEMNSLFRLVHGTLKTSPLLSWGTRSILKTDKLPQSDHRSGVIAKITSHTLKPVLKRLLTWSRLSRPLHVMHLNR
ncbi:hypothetical protein AB205_0004840 [Aquarana catesbeiana]|uniref:Uncharacterized protein n=1 Tax=Aquarana catesbeiana TaxID=8400 RepID=A0A2G9QKU3_AQUCT|nr:hypothetical protein AB205_0004840 [Aquarana catesbeiana]